MVNIPLLLKYNSVKCINYLLNSSDRSVINIVKICLNNNNGFLKCALINQNIELVSYLLRMNIVNELPSSKCSEKILNMIGISNDINNLMLECVQKGALKSLFYILYYIVFVFFILDTKIFYIGYQDI